MWTVKPKEKKINDEELAKQQCRSHYKNATDYTSQPEQVECLTGETYTVDQLVYPQFYNVQYFESTECTNARILILNSQLDAAGSKWF